MSTPVVDELLAAVTQLTPAELADFSVRFERLHELDGVSEETLLAVAMSEMPKREQRRLTQLAEKSERGELTPNELDEYRRLACQAQRLDATRIKALAQLAERRDQPVEDLMREIGWKGRNRVA